MADPVSLCEFNELITYRKCTRAKSTKGQVIETWSDHRKAIVKIERSQMSEVAEGERVDITGTITVTGHYDSNVDTKYRILLGSEYYNILSVEPLQFCRFMRVVATKVFD